MRLYKKHEKRFWEFDVRELPDGIRATHKVSFYGVRCYFDERTGALWGYGTFWEHLIAPVARIALAVGALAYWLGFAEDYESLFRFRILKQYEAEQ
jgi:hypothetical protein